MKFLKTVKNNTKGFTAKFTNGFESKSLNAAQFFMVMQDNDATPDELEGYIRLGKMIEPTNDWPEIQRISASFFLSVK